jgi:RNA polymerase sigma-70 factor, ECF subfamily
VRLSEEELLRLSQAGEMYAFEELVGRYEKKVYSIAYRFMGSGEDAADMAQEAFIRVYKAINKYRGESSFSTWLYHIVANVCRDELRKKGRITTIILENKEAHQGWSQEDPVEIVLEREEQNYLNSLILQLNDEFRVVVVMREMMGFSYEEIAGVLGCSLGTVKSRLCRSRRMLRDRILDDKIITVGTVKGGGVG